MPKFMLEEDQNYEILKHLQSDCRISNVELAQKVGMSASACWRRVQALEENGIIERYGAVINPEKIGLNLHAIVHIQLVRHEQDKLDHFMEAITNRPEIQECLATTGQADYHLRIRCRDLNAYNNFLEDFLFRIPAIKNAQTNIILKEVKRSGVLTP